MRGIRAISSRAAYRRRRDFYVPDTAPPEIEIPSTVDAPLYQLPGSNLVGLFAYVGAVVVATPSTWSDPDGAVTVTGQWTDLNGQPLAAVDETSLEFPEGVGGVVWRETASQGGHTVERYHYPPVTEIAVPAAPYMALIYPIAGSYTAGATLTKPPHVWHSILPFVVEGEWWKNGVATGVTTSTYSDTIDGDVIFWRETATDSAEQSSSTSAYPWMEPKFIVGEVAINAMVASMEAEVDALIAGNPGGTTQDLWGSYNASIAGTYNNPGNSPPLDRNPSFFAPSLVRQLTGIAAWKGPWGQYNCYTAITPRHVISCAHGSMGTTLVWFVHPETGEIHKNSVIRQVNDYGLWNGVVKPSYAPKQTLEADLQVGLLQYELPEWVMKYPVMEMTAEFVNRLQESGNPPTLYVSQGDATPARFPGTPNIWTLRGQKLCVSAVNHGDVTDPQRLLFRRYPLVNGDSGHPEFILLNGVLHLFRTYTSGSGDGSRIGQHVDYVNGMIARVDASASISTGYTLNLASSPYTGKEPLLADDDSAIELGDGSLLTRDF